MAFISNSNDPAEDLFRNIKITNGIMTKYSRKYELGCNCTIMIQVQYRSSANFSTLIKFPDSEHEMIDTIHYLVVFTRDEKTPNTWTFAIGDDMDYPLEEIGLDAITKK